MFLHFLDRCNYNNEYQLYETDAQLISNRKSVNIPVSYRERNYSPTFMPNYYINNYQTRNLD